MVCVKQFYLRWYPSLIERGEANPTWDTLKKVAAALDVKISELARLPKGSRARPDAYPRRWSRRSLAPFHPVGARASPRIAADVSAGRT